MVLEANPHSEANTLFQLHHSVCQTLADDRGICEIGQYVDAELTAPRTDIDVCDQWLFTSHIEAAEAIIEQRKACLSAFETNAAGLRKHAQASEAMTTGERWIAREANETWSAKDWSTDAETIRFVKRFRGRFGPGYFQPRDTKAEAMIDVADFLEACAADARASIDRLRTEIAASTHSGAMQTA